MSIIAMYKQIIEKDGMKWVNENREKVAVGELSTIEAAIAAARKAAEGEDLARIKSAVDELQRASHALAEALYKHSQSAGGPQSSGSGPKDAEVVDAEYAETR